MKEMAMNEIRHKGLLALKKALGSAGAIRFIQEINQGIGDYTKERETWLNNYSIDEIYEEIKLSRKK